MRASREKMLERLRQAQPPAVALPDVASSPVRFEDLAGKFAQSVTDVGGACVRVAGLLEAAAAIRALPVAREARQIVSLVPEVLPGNLSIDAVADRMASRAWTWPSCPESSVWPRTARSG